MSLFPESQDSRWTAWPDHTHGTLKSGESRGFRFDLTRSASDLDSTFRPLDIAVSMEMLLPGARYTIPEAHHEVPLDARFAPLPRPTYESVLRLDGDDDALRFESDDIAMPDGPMTLECGFRPEGFEGRTGLITKTESSEYGFFISDGKPQFSVHLDGKYRTAGSNDPLITSGDWHHIAGVFDGTEVRVYLDGELVDAVSGMGARTPNSLPLIIGADVDRYGNAMSPFAGEIDEVRLSSVARYSGSSFQPARRHSADADTRLLLNMDGSIGRWVIDAARPDTRGSLTGGARVGPQAE